MHGIFVFFGWWIGDCDFVVVLRGGKIGLWLLFQ